MHDREGALNAEIAALREKIDPAEEELATAEGQERNCRRKTAPHNGA